MFIGFSGMKNTKLSVLQFTTHVVYYTKDDLWCLYNVYLCIEANFIWMGDSEILLFLNDFGISFESKVSFVNWLFQSDIFPPIGQLNNYFNNTELFLYQSVLSDQCKHDKTKRSPNEK